MKKASLTPLVDYVTKTPIKNTMHDINVTDGDTDTINKDGTVDVDSLKTYHISSVTPMTMSSKTTTLEGSNEPKTLETLFFLCKDDISDMLFVLYHNYIVESEADKEGIKSIVFHDSNNYFSKMVAANMVIKHLPKFNTDLVFYANKDENAAPGDKFYTLAVPNGNNDKIYRFNFDADVFAGLACVDDYVCSSCENVNTHDLDEAILSASDKVFTFRSDVVIVDSIDDIISVAIADKKTNCIGVVYKVRSFIDGNTSETFKILQAWNVDIAKFKKKCNTTIEEIGKKYTDDADQYVASFEFNVRIGSNDKEYFVVKAVNKNGQKKLFFFDTDMQEKLFDMIEKF